MPLGMNEEWWQALMDKEGMGMIRRADNTTFRHRPGFLTGKGPGVLRVGKNVYLLGKFSRTEWQEFQHNQVEQPMPLTTIGGRKYWKYKSKCYWENEGYSARQMYALLETREQRKQQRVDVAEATVAMQSPRTASNRRAIPDDVKQYVWNRDGARCVQCGITYDLQYDHVIPLAMGGSNSPENLQLLCAPCNRAKGASLTNRTR